MCNNIGIIFHWGLYSVTGFDDIKSVRRRKMKNGSEWYYKRLYEKSDYRPISGHKETKLYHEKSFNSRDYYDLSKEFNDNTEYFDFDSIFSKLINDKISYVILTAKHHDGYCLWNTETTDKKSKKDLIDNFFKAAEKYNIKIGLYYSWFEFGKSMTIDFINKVVIPQINELKKYKPFYWWFDGDWEIKTKYAHNAVKNIVEDLRKDAIVNSRIVNNLHDITIFGDREYPEYTPPYKWEYIFTIGHSWGYNKAQEKCDYKDGKEIKRLYDIVMEKKGDFLINFGPKMNGELDENELKSYNDFIDIISEDDECKSN
jgi:alpha-L-fucosidase